MSSGTRQTENLTKVRTQDSRYITALSPFALGKTQCHTFRCRWNRASDFPCLVLRKVLVVTLTIFPAERPREFDPLGTMAREGVVVVESRATYFTLE